MAIINLIPIRWETVSHWLLECFIVTDLRNQINMFLGRGREQTHGHRQDKRSITGIMQQCRDTGKFDSDMGIMRCHTQTECRSYILVGNRGGVVGGGLSIPPHQGLVCGEETWLTGSLTVETMLNLSDLSPRQRWGVRTVLRGWWVINGCEGSPKGWQWLTASKVCTFPCVHLFSVRVSLVSFS